jgi:hypothetical protein
MEILQQTVQRTKQNEREEVMNTSTALEKQEALGQKSEKGRNNKLLFDLLSTLLVILIGFAVYKTTGLYDGMSSAAGKVGLGAVISYTYLAVFRRAFHSQ